MDRNPGSKRRHGNRKQTGPQNEPDGRIAKIIKAVLVTVMATLPEMITKQVRTAMTQLTGVTTLITERFKHGGLEFIMATGTLNEIETLIETLPNKRSIISIGIDEFAIPSRARVVYLKGNLEAVTMNQVENAPKRLFTERVFAGTFEWFRKFTALDGGRLVVLGGPGLAQPFIQNFAMRCAHAMFRDGKVIGTEINTNYLIAAPNTTRMIGTWLRKAPDTFVAQTVVDEEMSTRHTDIGTIGLMQVVTENGDVFVQATRQLAQGVGNSAVAWDRAAKLPTSVEDISVAFKRPDGTYRVIATMQEDNEYAFIPLDIRHEDGKIKVTVNMEEAIKRGTQVEYLGGFITLVGNSATFVDANGGPNMISLRGLDQIPDLAKMIRTLKPTTQPAPTPTARA